MAAGVYIMKDGPLKMSSNSDLKAEEVVIFFSGTDTNLEINGGANLNIIAPVEGAYKGFAFLQDPASNPGAVTVIQGGGTIEMEGALYTPTWTIELSGNGTMSDNADTWVMVADKFVIKGNSNMYLRANASNKDMEKVVRTVSAKVQLTK